MPLFITLIVLLLLAWGASKLIATQAQTRDPEKELLRCCMGDKKMAVRLTMFELKRNPRLTHTEAIKAAVQTYKRDS